jgi:DNA-directed RNA polymerase sigma subunit (sigma70/sigma32)
MAGSMSWIDGNNDDAWPSDEGWPYDDGVRSFSEMTDVTEFDDELVSLHAAAPHLFDDLEPVERQILTARFGLDGGPARTLKELQRELGLPRDDLRAAYADGLAKLRRHLR